jgi:hypothetical protein
MLKIYNNNYKYSNMDIMAIMVVTYHWLTNVKILTFLPQVATMPKSHQSSADRGNQEISIHGHDCDRPSGMLHRAVWYQRVSVSGNKNYCPHLLSRTKCYQVSPKRVLNVQCCKTSSSRIKRHIVLSSLVCTALPHSFTLPHKRKDFRKKVTKHNKRVLVFSTTSAWNISQYKNNWAWYY